MASSRKPRPPAPPPRRPRRPKPRAQVAYEGDDEFSVMSTHPARKKAALELSPKAAPPKVEDEPEEKRPALNKWQFIKKILDR